MDENSENPVPLQRNKERSAARLAAVQALYQMDVAGTDLNDVLSEFRDDYFSGSAVEDGENGEDGGKAASTNVVNEEPQALDHAFLADILNGVLKGQAEMDPIIDAQLREGWRLNRIDSILRAILRSGTFELKERVDVPVAVIIDEYLNIAHAFFEKDEPRVVNGVLDKLARRLRPGDLNQNETA